MSKFKIVVNIAALVAFGWLVYISRNQIQDTLGQLSDNAWWFLVLMVPVQLIGYATVAHLYYSYFQSAASLGRLKIREMYRIALELNFVNSVFPSGGVSGFSYLSLRLRPLDINFATSTLAQSLRFALTLASFMPLLGLGLFILALDSRANNIAMLLGGLIFCLIIVGMIAFVYLIGSKQRINSFVSWLPKAINKTVQVLHYRSDKELISMRKVERVLGEIHAGYRQLYKNWPSLKQPFLYAMANNFFELLTIYLVFLAFGEVVNPGAVILAYAVANFAGLVALSPGGIGVYEFLMAATLISTGVIAEDDVAIAATLTYRVINLLVFVPVGLLLYYQAVNRRQAAPPVLKPVDGDVLTPLVASTTGGRKASRRRRKKKTSV